MQEEGADSDGKVGGPWLMGQGHRMEHAGQSPPKGFTPGSGARLVPHISTSSEKTSTLFKKYPDRTLGVSAN